MNRRTPEYLEHLKSPAWKQIRRQALENASYKCQDCGIAAKGLHVHHLTYERLGNELASDLRALCPPCHKKADRQREWIARVTAYALKRWGEDWEYDHDWPEVAEAFAQYLERAEAR